jgi:hypothetical protein
MLGSRRSLTTATLFAALALLALTAGCARKERILSSSVDLPPHILSLMRDRTSGSTERGCMGCHNPNTSPRVDLTTYQSVYDVRLTVRSRISAGGSMRQYLLTGEPEVIINWIDQGAPR